MLLDSDIALLGTGVASLVAANVFLTEGKKVLLLNPDSDFFEEDSELPLDPFWPLNAQVLSPDRISESLPENAISELSPCFPGALQLWPESQQQKVKDFHDPSAPHVRSRSRLWIESPDYVSRSERRKDWELIEDMYVRASDAGLNPLSLDGISAWKRFPGFSSGKTEFRGADQKGILLPKICDVDVSRYRNGLREFIRERVSPELVITSASQIELIPEGVRFRSGGALKTARLREGMMVFWTPRLTHWILTQIKKQESTPVMPEGIRIWEEWSLVSREQIDPSIVGVFENMTVWSPAEGVPKAENTRGINLSVLRAGRRVSLDAYRTEALSWASGDSFRGLSRLTHDFLKWENYTVRAMKPRSILEWDESKFSGDIPQFSLKKGNDDVRVICSGGGPLVNVVKTARKACEQYL